MTEVRYVGIQCFQLRVNVASINIASILSIFACSRHGRIIVFSKFQFSGWNSVASVNRFWDHQHNIIFLVWIERRKPDNSNGWSSSIHGKRKWQRGRAKSVAKCYARTDCTLEVHNETSEEFDGEWSIKCRLTSPIVSKRWLSRR